jgi:ribosomal-protein-alanine acetyltransferase
MTWRLRRATVDDLDAIMRLEEEMFPSDSWSRELMREELAASHSYYLVALGEGGGLDGYAGLRAPDGSPEADIQTVAVVPSVRRQGLGRRLVDALVAEARSRGAEEVFLEVRVDNPGAQQLYTSLGFVNIAVREHYYQPDDVAAQIMRLALVAAP